MNTFANIEVSLHLPADLREDPPIETVAALEKRTIVDHAITVEVRPCDLIDWKAGVLVSDGGEFEPVEPFQRRRLQGRLIESLDNEIMTYIAVRVAIVAMNVGRIADTAAFADVVVEGVGVHIVDREFKAARKPLLQCKKATVET